MPLILITEAGEDEQLTIPGMMREILTPCLRRSIRISGAESSGCISKVSRQRQELPRNAWFTHGLDEQRGMQAVWVDEEERYRSH